MVTKRGTIEVAPNLDQTKGQAKDNDIECVNETTHRLTDDKTLETSNVTWNSWYPRAPRDAFAAD